MMMMNDIDTATQRGFTLVELMIVVAVIGIISAIAYPSYQGYIERGMRADMMSEMHNISAQIQSRKLEQGSYRSISTGVTSDLAGNYPRQGEALYSVAMTPSPLTSEWTITATPIPSMRMADDGTLTLNYLGVKCRGDGADKKCGTGDEWK